MTVPAPTRSERAMPKSMIVALFTSPSGKMMLSGETSRWTTPNLCAAPSAEAMRFCKTRTSASGSGPDASLLVNDGPSTNSIAR